MTYFSQSFPDIRVKLKRPENGPLTAQEEILTVPFKVYHGKEEKAPNLKYPVMTKASQLAKAEAQAF